MFFLLKQLEVYCTLVVYSIWGLGRDSNCKALEVEEFRALLRDFNQGGGPIHAGFGFAKNPPGDSTECLDSRCLGSAQQMLWRVPKLLQGFNLPLHKYF